MLIANKKKLDSLENREVIKSVITKVLIAALLLAILVWGNYHWEKRAVTYKKAIKEPVMGTFKTCIGSRTATSCYFEIAPGKVVLVRSALTFSFAGQEALSFYTGQTVKLIKVTEQSGNTYYEISPAQP